MKSHYDLQQQLDKLGLKFRFFGKSEMMELRKILHHDETIIECVYGFYQGGSGLLVATDQRLLLIDKRPFYLNLEDISYDRIRNIALSPAWLQAALQIWAGHVKIHFRSVSDARLRRLKDHTKQMMQSLQTEASEVIESLQTPKMRTKPYHNPAWRPHHTILARRKPTKFYPLHHSVQLSIDS